MATCSSGIQRDMIPDNILDRMDKMKRQMNRLARTTPSRSGGGGRRGGDREGGSDGGGVFGIPIGGIILWSGAIADIPESWALCDGDNGTPDLRNSFIVAAGDTYAVDDTGGEDSSDLSHTHGTGTLVTDNDTHDHAVNAGNTASGGSHQHGDGTLSNSTTGSHRHSVGTYSTSTPSTSETVESGATESVPGSGHIHQVTGQSAYAGDHAHTITGNTASGGSHTHGSGSLDTDNDTHNHTVSGSTASAGSAAQENRPAYYSLAFIMRLAD